MSVKTDMVVIMTRRCTIKSDLPLDFLILQSVPCLVDDPVGAFVSVVVQPLYF